MPPFASPPPVARERGQVSDADLAAVKLAGYSDAQVVEIVGLVALNVFTNFINNVAQTDIDFPIVRAAEAA
jgi:alkylhydroperoxidase family enzyme